MERAEESSEASKEDFRMKLKMNKAYEIVLLESSRMEADDKKIKNDKQKLFRMMKDAHVRFTRTITMEKDISKISRKLEKIPLQKTKSL